MVDTNKQKNSSLSIKLILVNLILLLVFFNCTYTTENQTIFNVIIFFISLTFLLGGYTFSYRGKNHKSSRRLFYISLLISAILTYFLFYMLALGKAYQH